MAPLMSKTADAVQRWLWRRGVHVARSAPNRFAAIPEALRQLHRRGYRPRVVIDGGANVGRFTSIAHELFPDAAFNLIEPQPGCAPFLDALTRRVPSAAIFPLALTSPGVEQVRMLGAEADSHGESAWVVEGDTSAQTMTLPATTLDGLFAGRYTRADRVLLKLDLEGQELNALRGAERLLTIVELVLSEVRFFEIHHSGQPAFRDIAEFLWARGFELYDVAALMPRARDGRLYLGDVVFVRRDSALLEDVAWQ
jgi:FkbM family methyltransferase